MENSAYGLKMAGGMLMVVLVISLIIYTFDNMKKFPNENQTRKYEEQIQVFNKEYEVYNKKQMYGTDVISCLNLAYNNNTTLRVFGDSTEPNSLTLFSSTTKGVEQRKVEVTAKLKSALKTNIEVYYYNPQTHSESKVGAAQSLNDIINSTQRLDEIFRGAQGELTDIKPILEDIYQVSNINNATIRDLVDVSNLDNKYSINNIVLNKQFHKNVTEKNKANSKEIHKLMRYTGRPVIEIKNNAWNISGNSWTKIVIKTPANDLKSRKFKCIGIEYYLDSKDIYADGRIKSISFVEI